MKKARKSVLFLTGVGLFLGGCWAARVERRPVYPVSGQRFVRGLPAGNARIELRAANDRELDRLCPHAIVKADGFFEITTFDSADGAPIGNYALTVSWPLAPKRRFDAEGPDRFKGRFSDPRRPVRKVEIIAGDNYLGRIELN
jgi:hypothetical protein